MWLQWNLKLTTYGTGQYGLVWEVVNSENLGLNWLFYIDHLYVAHSGTHSCALNSLHIQFYIIKIGKECERIFTNSGADDWGNTLTPPPDPLRQLFISAIFSRRICMKLVRNPNFVNVIFLGTSKISKFMFLGHIPVPVSEGPGGEARYLLSSAPLQMYFAVFKRGSHL